MRSSRLQMWRGFLPGLMIAGVCTGGAAQTPEWTVGPARVTIGVQAGDPHYELAGAASSIRLPDGRIVVGDIGSHQLRFYSADGRYLRAAGRRGGGPGEFSGPITILRLGTAGIEVYDVTTRRVSVFDTAGTFVTSHEVESTGPGNFPLTSWLYGRSWITGPADTMDRARVAAALDRMPAPPPHAYRAVLVATDGYLWTRMHAVGSSPGPWRVHAPDGTPAGRVALPTRFIPQEIGPGYVLGDLPDADDVDHIVLLPLTRPRQPAGRPGPAAPRRPHAAAAARPLNENYRGFLRMLVVAQEAHYADYGSYAGSIDSLRIDRPDDGIDLLLLKGDKLGWVLGIVPPEGPMCAIGIGAATPPGWPEAIPMCGQ